MKEIKTYKITDAQTEIVIARGMDLFTALVLVEGLLTKLIEEDHIGYKIESEGDSR